MEYHGSFNNNWALFLQDHIDKLALSAEKTKKLQNESKSHFFGVFRRFFGIRNNTMEYHGSVKKLGTNHQNMYH